MKCSFIAFIFLLIALKSDLINGEFREYASNDDPVCTSDCSSIQDQKEKQECFKKQLDFHNYKLVKSIFNFGKSAIYAGLWSFRNVRLNDLFEYKLMFIFYSRKTKTIHYLKIFLMKL